MENKSTDSKSKKMWILLGVLAVIVIIIIVAAVSQNKPGGNTPTGTTPGGTTPTGTTGTTTAPDASLTSKTEGLIDAPAMTTESGEIVSLKDAKVVVPGANPITKDNKVVTAEGKQTVNAARPMDADAPKQTSFLDKATLPKTLTQISVGNGSFSPGEFSTKAGAPTSFSLTGVGESAHLIVFDDPALAAIIILVGPGQTKAITFNAPATAGTYTFHCDSPGHIAKGEVGKMIVK